MKRRHFFALSVSAILLGASEALGIRAEEPTRRPLSIEEILEREAERLTKDLLERFGEPNVWGSLLPSKWPRDVH